jgi:tRNA-specific 2-thiouridylase
MTKTEVRNYASELKFNELSKKKDSLGVCFIEGSNYRMFLNSRGIKTEPGNFLNEKNEIIGQHKGITNYTIGQRRGLGVNSNQPLFVSEIRAIQNEIVLSNYNVLFKSTIYLNNYCFVNKEDIKIAKIFMVKIRYRLQNNKCRITVLNDNLLKVELLEPLAMVANGQTAVFYDNERVVGGGFIESSE